MEKTDINTTERRALSLEERNITKTEVTIVEQGMMVSRLLGSKMYHVVLALDLEITQIKFYMEQTDNDFKRFCTSWSKY